MKNQSKIISIRASDADIETIKNRATKAGQSVSRYLVENATCAHGLTKSQKQNIFHSICKIKDSAKSENYAAISRECDIIWQSLK